MTKRRPPPGRCRFDPRRDGRCPTVRLMAGPPDESQHRESELRVQALLDRGEQLLIEARQTMAALDDALDGEPSDDEDDAEPVVE